MRKNVFRAKGLTLLLTAALLVPQMSGVSADAKAKKPKLSRTKVSVTVGKTKKVTVKNAKKVTWKVTKKAAKIVKLTKKSKKGATIKGLKNEEWKEKSEKDDYGESKQCQKSCCYRRTG